jgi:hypothetical protein
LPDGLLFGIVCCASLLWVFLFASAGAIEVATLLCTVATLIWFATVDRRRLVDGHRRPEWRLFLVAGIALTILVSAMKALGSGTMFLTLAVGTVGLVVGGVRAVRTQTDPGR